MELDAAAREAGITILGVEPGVDHLYAVKLIDKVYAQGGKFESSTHTAEVSRLQIVRIIRSASSFHGLHVVLFFHNATLQSFFQMIKLSKFLLTIWWVHLSLTMLMDEYDFVAYSDRNSVLFQKFYQILEAHTVIRRSLRYKENLAFVQALTNLEWLDQNKKDWLKEGMTWTEIFQKAINAFYAWATWRFKALLCYVTRSRSDVRHRNTVAIRSSSGLGKAWCTCAVYEGDLRPH